MKGQDKPLEYGKKNKHLISASFARSSVKYLKTVLVFNVQQLLCQDRAAVTHSTYRVQGKVPREGGRQARREVTLFFHLQ